MKSTIIFLTILTGGVLTSCDKNLNPVTTPENLEETVQQGNWKITYFWDDKDETYHFNGYEFTFEDNGVITASNGTSVYNGTWSTGTDDSTVKLNINFSAPAEFEDLSDDWHIMTKTDNLIELNDVSGGDGSIDYLTFSRN